MQDLTKALSAVRFNEPLRRLLAGILKVSEAGFDYKLSRYEMRSAKRLKKLGLVVISGTPSMARATDPAKLRRLMPKTAGKGKQTVGVKTEREPQVSTLTELRDSCLDCVRKHLAQAEVLMHEAAQGYSTHRWRAIGHMGEAADECCKDYPKLAEAIRKHRVRYMADPSYSVPVMDLIEKATSLGTKTEERIGEEFMPNWKDPRRSWQHVGGDLEASYDGARYVDLRDRSGDRLLFVSRGTLKNAIRLFRNPIAEATDVLPPNTKAEMDKRVVGIVKKRLGLEMKRSPGHKSYASKSSYTAYLVPSGSTKLPYGNLYVFSVDRMGPSKWAAVLYPKGEPNHRLAYSKAAGTVSKALQSLTMKIKTEKEGGYQGSLSAGDRVTGYYRGQKFSGTIQPHHPAQGRGIGVEFDKPLEGFLGKEDSALIDRYKVGGVYNYGSKKSGKFRTTILGKLGEEELDETKPPIVEDLGPEDQKLADGIVAAHDRPFDDEMWQEVRTRLHGHPDGVPGLIRTEEREVNADGTFSCGVFLPVPSNIARLFPNKDEHDDSAPHFTLLFAGDLSPADYGKLVDEVGKVARSHDPFLMRMGGYGEFTNNDGQTIPHMIGRAWPESANLNELHDHLRLAAERVGVPIAHTYGPEEDPKKTYAEQFKTHATLAYIDPGEPAYKGHRPGGSWKVTSLECWGHEKYQVPLGATGGGMTEQTDLAEGTKTKKKPIVSKKKMSPKWIKDPNNPKIQIPNPAFKEAFLKGTKKKVKKTASPKASDAKVYVKDVETVAGKLAGKPLKVEKYSASAKGFDYTFVQGGRVKIRPKSEGIVAKLQGQPKAHYRYRGMGTTIKGALASMKPEKTKGKAPAPPHVQTAKAAKKPAKKPWATGKPGPKQAKVNGIMLFNDLGVDQETWDRYATACKDSVDMIKRRGFGFMLPNVTMHLRVGGLGVLGNYDMKTKLVEIFVNSIGAKKDPAKIMTTMVHELGHHYYYREIPRARRKTYAWYFGLAKKPTEKGGKHGDFPSSYGATKRYEDFAEIFAAYIGKGHQLSGRYKLTRDIMDRFRAFMAPDKRVDLREDRELFWSLLERRELVTLGFHCACCEAAG